MTEKRLCTNCKHSRGLGYDFWCGEGHTEYEVFGAETNCPYYEYHDWSKGTPSKNEKRFTTVELPKPNRWGIWYDGAYLSTYQVCILLNEYVDVKKENEQLKLDNKRLLSDYTDVCNDNIAVGNENEQLKNKIERIDFILDDLNGAEYISRDDGIKALNKIDKVIGKR